MHFLVICISVYQSILIVLTFDISFSLENASNLRASGWFSAVFLGCLMVWKRGMLQDMIEGWRHDMKKLISYDVGMRWRSGQVFADQVAVAGQPRTLWTLERIAFPVPPIRVLLLVTRLVAFWEGYAFRKALHPSKVRHVIAKRQQQSNLAWEPLLLPANNRGLIGIVICNNRKYMKHPNWTSWVAQQNRPARLDKPLRIPFSEREVPEPV